MNRDDIIRMAREAFIARGFWPNEVMWVCWKDSWLLAYEAGRKDENEACASLEVHLITPTRDYTTMSPLDCYEAALMDEAMAFRAAIRARREQ